MRLLNTYALAVVLTGPFVGAGYARAAPEVSASATGGCPTQSELERCLVGRGLRIGGSEYLVTTQGQFEEVVVQLVRNRNEVLLTRRFSSGDCRAVAEAAAVVVEAYFIEVRGWARELDAQQNTRPVPSASVIPRVPVQSTAAAARPAPADVVREQPTAARGNPTQSEPQPTRVTLPLSGRAQDGGERLALPQAVVHATLFMGAGPTLALPGANPSVQVEAGGGLGHPISCRPV